MGKIYESIFKNKLYEYHRTNKKYKLFGGIIDKNGNIVVRTQYHLKK